MTPTVPERDPEVLVFTVDAGGGHRAAARALVAAAEEKGAPFRLQVENLQEILAAEDLVRRWTGLSLEAGYNLILRRRWTVLLVPLLRMMHGAIRLRRRSLVRALRRHLEARPRPAAVLSVMPNLNGVIRDAVAGAHPGVPFSVLLTDFADFPPRFWIEPGLDRVIVGTDRARAQARQIGLPEERIARVSGMVLHPRFYQMGGMAAHERIRREMRIEDGFVVLLLFGGKGSPEMEPLSARLLDGPPAFRVIAICGDNRQLHAKLAPLEARANGRFHRVGFTDRVADFMAAADVLVTKPGPGSLAEAFQEGVPVVVVKDRHTIPQERFNTRFVEEHGLGVVVGGWEEIPGAVKSLAGDPQRLESLRAAIRALPPNRAVYEVIEILEKEVGGAGRTEC
jgi:UDP-N-acetylglucosamine:LPS N-acetylglucosamine transferase